MEFEHISYEVDGGIATLTFRRPEVLNAHNHRMKAEIQAAATTAAEDPDVRVLLVTGAGRGFHAGEDVKEVFLGGDGLQMKTDRARALLGDGDPTDWNGQVSPLYFYRYPKPTVAAVNGVAVGAGLSIALSCDIRIASDAARFGYLYTRRGLMGPSHAIRMLVNLLGASRALEMMLSGELIGAAEAHRIGLVSRVVPAGELLDAATEVARKLLRGAPLAQRAIKQTVYKALYDPVAMDVLNTLVEQALLESEDHHEGARAFVERRDPKWTGR